LGPTIVDEVSYTTDRYDRHIQPTGTSSIMKIVRDSFGPKFNFPWRRWR